MGKLIGALLGLYLADIPGLLLGLAAGHLFDSGLRKIALGSNLGVTQEIFFRCTFELMGRVAKVDGRVSEDEIAITQQLMDHFRLNDAHREEAIAHFKRGAIPTFDVDACLDEFMAVAATQNNLRQMLLGFLISTAFADQHLDRAENELLRHIGERLGFDQGAFERLLGMFQAQDHFSPGSTEAPLSDAYQALGVGQSAGDRDVKLAYRRLMKQFHPDKLIAQGLPDDMIRSATERSQEIQAAYARVKVSRGM